MPIPFNIFSGNRGHRTFYKLVSGALSTIWETLKSPFGFAATNDDDDDDEKNSTVATRDQCDLEG